MHFLNQLSEYQGIIRLIYTCFCISVLIKIAVNKIAVNNDYKNRCSERRLVFAFLLVSPAVFLISRLPVIYFNAPLNPDEAEMVVNANKYFTNMNTWQSVDTDTSGPLDSFVLMWPGLFGYGSSIAVARLTRAVILIAAWLLLFLSMNRTILLIRILIASALMIFMIGTISADFIHYSTETLPILLLAAAVFFTFLLIEGEVGWIGMATSGLLLGAIPYAKIQAAPIAVVIGAFQIGLLLSRLVERSSPFKNIAALTIGALAPTVFILTPLAFAGGLIDFWISYILHAVYYINFPLAPKGEEILSLLDHDPELIAFLLNMIVLVVIGIFLSVDGLLKTKKHSMLELVFAVGFLIVSCYVVIIPGYFFSHYSLFLLWPFALLAGSFWTPAVVNRLTALRRSIAIGFILVPLIFLFVGSLTLQKYGPLSAHISNSYFFRNLDVAGVESFFSEGNLIGNTETQDHRMLVWGWMPEFYLYANVTPATRDIVTANQIIKIPTQSYYRERMMTELTSRHPEYLVDAVAPWSFFFHDPVAQGIASFSKLNALVENEYTIVSRSGKLCPRIYAPKSLAEALQSRYAVIQNLRASSFLELGGWSFAPDQVTDGMLFENCPNEWLLPDGRTGNLSFDLASPHAIGGIQILNTRNWPFFNRASRQLQVEAYRRGQVVFKKDVRARRYPYWTEIPVPRDVGEVDSVTIRILDFVGLGGGLKQVRVQTANEP